MATFFGKLYLLYLSILPAVGTFLLVFVIHVPPLLFFLVGTAAVGIYLAITNSYTVIGTNPWKNLALLIDGPIWIAFGLLFGGMVTNGIVEDVLMEMTSMLLGTLGVVLLSKKPTKDQRLKSLIAVGIPLLGTLGVSWMYGNAFLAGQTVKWVVLGAATVQGTIAQYRNVHADQVQRPAEGYIIVGIVLWVAALIAGSVWSGMLN